jgi:hypothetical protein
MIIPPHIEKSPPITAARDASVDIGRPNWIPVRRIRTTQTRIKRYAATIADAEHPMKP